MWKPFVLLFLSGFVNDSILTAYYVEAGRGAAWTCVGLCAAQQVLAIFQARATLLVEGLSERQRLMRMAIVALGYTTAAYTTVRFFGQG